MTNWRSPQDRQEKNSRAIRSMIPGSLDGRIVQARPVSTSTSIETFLTEDEEEPDSDLGVGEDGDDQEYHWFTDTHIVRTLGDQTIRLTYIPVDFSVDIFYGGAYIPESNWTLHDDRYVTLSDPEHRYHVDRKLTARYVWLDQTPEDPEMVPVTIDIPGVVYEYDHAGSPGGIIGTGVSADDGDTGYMWFGNDGGGNGGTWGWALFVKFPATPIPGDISDVSLVVSSKGPEPYTTCAQYIANHGLNPLNFRTTGASTLRDMSEYTTPPDYGYLDDGFWGDIRQDTTENAEFSSFATSAAGNDALPGTNTASGMDASLQAGSGTDPTTGSSEFRTDALNFTALPMSTTPDSLDIRGRWYGTLASTSFTGNLKVVVSSAGSQYYSTASLTTNTSNFQIKSFTSWTAIGTPSLTAEQVFQAGATVYVFADGFASAPGSSGFLTTTVGAYVGGDYVTTVTPLHNPPIGDSNPTPYVYDPDWPLFITKDMITMGRVEYNPGGGFYINGFYVGDSTDPSLKGPDLRISYVALRVTYTEWV